MLIILLFTYSIAGFSASSFVGGKDSINGAKVWISFDFFFLIICFK